METMNEVLLHLRRAVFQKDGAGLTDRQLLGCFIDHRDEAAVATLVRRHGPMVWGVCRRVLGDHHDAEDAFQATFVVLVRRAASIRPREMVGNWLYGVAHQTALKARALRARRRTRERQVAELPEPSAVPPDLRQDLQTDLDQELTRLPDKYRVAIVLCDLEGKTRREAARQLGLPEGTLAGRLTRGRALLARRLARNRAVLSGGIPAAILSEIAASASVPASLMSSTFKATGLLAVGQIAGATSDQVAAITEGVLKAMLLSKIKTVLGICLVVGLLALGGVFGYGILAADKVAPAPAKDRLADTLILLDKQWWEAASNYDVDTLAKILANDWEGFNATGPLRWTKADSLDRYRRGRYTEVKFLTEREVFRIDEHTAMMSYEVEWRGEEKDGTQSGPGRCRIIHCWVQRDGGWFVKRTECVNLPVPLELIKPSINPFPGPPGQWIQPKFAPNLRVRASSSWEPDHRPDKAFDGSGESYWNSGGHAPAWIEADLGASKPVATIRLKTVQDIPGPTVHEVWIADEPSGDDRAKAKLAHVFEGDTKNGQTLEFAFPKQMCARYVLVRTTQSPTWIAWCGVEIRTRDQGQQKPVPPR
jgi:RNA polymerase sigma factor (sigma-70 family)